MSCHMSGGEEPTCPLETSKFPMLNLQKVITCLQAEKGYDSIGINLPNERLWKALPPAHALAGEFQDLGNEGYA
ncbi:hypothetical protein BTVI_04938 [Pitangus sulphuratus]|nr:hypothetical protein BTVI_04938 [Pitangus sulphuratus]